MRTTIDLSEVLLARVKKLMHKRKTTLRALVEEGLQRRLNDERAHTPFKLRDASFKGEVGFVEGAGPEDMSRVLRELNEGVAEDADFWPVFATCLAGARAAGGAVHDTRIAACCRYHGVRELWTADRDFSRYPWLATRNPL